MWRYEIIICCVKVFSQTIHTTYLKYFIFTTYLLCHSQSAHLLSMFLSISVALSLLSTYSLLLLFGGDWGSAASGLATFLIRTFGADDHSVEEGPHTQFQNIIIFKTYQSLKPHSLIWWLKRKNKRCMNIKQVTK